MPCAIVSCGCFHEFQDQLYGKNQRIHNLAPKHGTAKAGAWRCTVCGKEKDVARSTAK